MKIKALTRDDRKRQIMLAFAVNIQSGHDGRMTLADIARKLQLSVSTKLRDMVVELELEGLLDHVVEPMPGIVGKRFIYAPTAIFDSRTGKHKHTPHKIAIKGKSNGQQAMWDEVLS
jgi:hypothetical protein